MYLPNIDFSFLSYVFSLRFVIKMPTKLRIIQDGNPLNSLKNIKSTIYPSHVFYWVFNCGNV
jgi:hypothetical protein